MERLPRVAPGPGARVLVPLCGKSGDLEFLASRGHPVTGVELVEDAVRAFFGEHALEPRERREEARIVLEHAQLAIWGNFWSPAAEYFWSHSTMIKMK